MIEAREYLAAEYERERENRRVSEGSVLRRYGPTSWKERAALHAIEAALAASSRRTEEDLERAAEALFEAKCLSLYREKALAVLEAVGIRIGDGR